MATGIAGDSTTTLGTGGSSSTTSLTSAQAQDLLTQILIELRTLTNVTINLSPVPAQDLANIRIDQNNAVNTGQDY